MVIFYVKSLHVVVVVVVVIALAGGLVCVAEGHAASVKDVRWISASKLLTLPIIDSI